jgi:hypothetical protein
MIGARLLLAIARPPPVRMTGGRDAVFTGRSAMHGCSLDLPGGWVSRPDGRPSGAGGGSRSSIGPGVLALRWWCTFASAASITAPARCVAALIVFAFVGLGIDLILSSAGFLRRANQVVVGLLLLCHC